ncbi:MAG: chlorophyll synthesis pathway protein BchC [Woeseiaceae bacterium]
METLAVVMQQPRTVTLSRLPLSPLADGEVAVQVRWSGISTGTERLLWTGEMPEFPGMGYPLVPGYETVGEITHAAVGLESRIGELVFVSGARCYGEVRGLFGGAASNLICPAEKAIAISSALEAKGVLLALAATARHACQKARHQAAPDLVIGHGVLGRLIARLIVADGHPPPTVWEVNAARREGEFAYPVIDPATDQRRDYGCICDVSGDTRVLDELISRAAPQGELILAGFYASRVSFDFPPAFMRELTIRIAAEWQPADLQHVVAMADRGELNLGGLITHTVAAVDAADAYTTAFSDDACLKMILDWSDTSEC